MNPKTWLPSLMSMFGGNSGMSVAGGPSPAMKPYQQLTAEELQSWQGYDPNIQKSRATQYANAYNQQQQPGSQPPAQEGPGLLGKMKTGMQNIGEAYGGFEDRWRKAAIEGGYMKDPSANNPYGASPENQALSAATDQKIEGVSDVTPDEIRATSTSKKDYIDKMEAVKNMQASPEGQAYAKNAQTGMQAGTDALANQSGGWNPVQYFMGKWFGPKFDWSTDASKLKYDIPPELR